MMLPKAALLGVVVVLAACGMAAAQPTVTTFSPSSGSVGSVVTVSGLNFDPTPFATTVSFGGVEAGAVTVHASGASLTAVVPGGAVTGPITVTTGLGAASSAGLPRPTFTVSDVPELVGFFPESGVAGQTVRLYGRSLLGVTSVTFTGGASVMPPFLVRVDAAGTVVEAQVHAGAVSGPITVTTAGGSASTASLEPVPPDGSGGFLLDLPPEVDAFYPASGPPGTVLIVNGRNLFHTVTVSVGGAVAAIARVDDSGTSVEARVPSDATTGVVAVETPLGTANSAGLDVPAFVVDGTPRIDGVYPPRADVGAVVTVYGANLGAAAIPPFIPSENQVAFGAVGWDVVSVSPYRTSLTARVAGGSAGSAPVVVTTPGGSAASPEPFTVSGVPVVTGFQPGSAMPGARIAVIGFGLGRATAVAFDGTLTTDFASDVAGTVLEVTVPADATSGPIAVTTSDGHASTADLSPPRIFVVTRSSPCGNGTIDPGEACDDGNLAPGDCCDGRCRVEPSGATCDDGVFCNGVDACDAGACVVHAGDPCGGGTECANACNETARDCVVPADASCGDDGDLCTDDVCDGGGACVHLVRPRRVCKVPVRAGASRLEIVRAARPGKTRLEWRFTHGEATAAPELGDPTGTTRHAFCLFDGAGTLVWRADVPAGGTCGAKPCWRVQKDTVTYEDPTLGTSGIRHVDVKAARAGRSRAGMLGKGPALEPLPLPIASLPVTAQLGNDAGGCWAASYSKALRSRSDAFVARSEKGRIP